MTVTTHIVEYNINKSCCFSDGLKMSLVSHFLPLNLKSLIVQYKVYDVLREAYQALTKSIFLSVFPALIKCVGWKKCRVKNQTVSVKSDTECINTNKQQGHLPESHKLTETLS